jgi:hypothetical protein
MRRLSTTASRGGRNEQALHQRGDDLDGVIDGFEWFVSEGGHDQAALGHLAGARVMLVGRKSYEGFAGYWPAQEGPWADVINPNAQVRCFTHALGTARVERTAA